MTCSTWSSRCRRLPSTAPGPCGSSRSSKAWKAAASAFVQKIHHTLTDGVGGIELALTVLDDRRDSPNPALPREPTAGEVDAVANVRDALVTATRSTVRIGADVPRFGVQAALGTVRDPFGSVCRARRHGVVDHEDDRPRPPVGIADPDGPQPSSTLRHDRHVAGRPEGRGQDRRAAPRTMRSSPRSSRDCADTTIVTTQRSTSCGSRCRSTSAIGAKASAAIASRRRASRYPPASSIRASGCDTSERSHGSGGRSRHSPTATPSPRCSIGSRRPSRPRSSAPC